QDLAKIRLAQLLIDSGEYGEARQTIAAMAEDTGNPYTKSAQELMGLAAYAAGDMEEAHGWFRDLRDVAGTPPQVQGRARFMLDLIKQTSGVGAETTRVTAAEETN
ncbi:MAG: tetratricopeptide repeat protein, partial [Pseudomonadota bacterium]